jgi:hypothetical protein
LYREAKKKGQRKPEYSLSIPRIVGYALVVLLVVGAGAELLI